MLNRREWLVRALSGTAASLAVGALLPEQLRALGTGASPAADPSKVVIYKSPTCGCCRNWVKAMEAAGYTFVVHDVPDVTPMKTSLGVPTALQSCHTAILGSYVLEGHVPADLAKKLQREKPAIAGLAVPGMPRGSMGMEMGDAKDKYDVVAWDKKGKSWVYASR